MKDIKKKCFGIIVCMVLVAATLSTVTANRDDTTPPTWQNQGQTSSSIKPVDSNILSAQGKDDVAIRYAFLSTNESGTWQDIKGLLNWAYSKKILVDHLQVKEDLTDFPILVKITDATFSTHAQTDGDDFVFYDATNTTKYSHEIESYDSPTGTLVAWVKIPFLSSTVDTVFYLYYGNPSASDQRNTEDVWSNGYVMIHHMTGSAVENLLDSTSSNFDMTAKGDNPTFNQAGKIGKCVEFDGSNDYLQAGGYSLNGSYTTSTWVYYTGTFGTDGYVFSGSGTAYKQMTPTTTVNTGKKYRSYIVSSTGTPTYATSTTTLSSTSRAWHYVTGRVDYPNKNLSIYVNGTYQAKASYTTIKNATSGLNIAKNGTNGNFYKGKIDELRISNVKRTNGWIQTEYNTMANGGFLTVSPENTVTVFGGKTHESPMELEQNDQWQWSNFTWCNPSVPEDSTVGWKITYVDTSGNSVSTDVLHFKISLNDPPYIPSNPGPLNGSTDVATTTLLTWTGDDPNLGDIVTYSIYLGTTPSPPKVNETTSLSYDPEILLNSTRYYWKIIATDNIGASTEGPLWTFSTFNQPPYVPKNPSPANGSTHIPVDQDLSWTGGDPDHTSPVYDVYFGDTTPPPLVAINHSTTTYTLDPLSFNITYYWKIITKDNFSLLSEGPEWHFTVKPEFEPPYAPSNPNPANGSINVSVTTSLSWSCSDSNIPPGTLTYDVYLGTSTTPALVASTVDHAGFQPAAPLDFNTTYYWRIVAWNNHSLSTSGRVWHFKTKIDTRPVLNIRTVKGGMQLKIFVENIGRGDIAKPVFINISFQGGSILYPKGGQSNKTIDEMKAGTAAFIRQPVFGFAFNKDLTVTAECPQSLITKTTTTYKATVFGPFILIK